ncbi:ABC transporter substrate-binding protein [Goodfellowiella coeruleoviolacea]|uniref:Cellobiose-binding protein n=1 Tax=Goodfellowiella coeruleoviolacea TaxID=334858 RepID=A0AAE3KF80_9PSEU|nr:ABC transporter substrate-binding protein [Goodfellowiella coeruleoviolacea]MCP2164164.1 cellobiose-binding protein [Goodfellowiella coeruleoviolacea]
MLVTGGALAACGGSDDGPAADGKIHLTIATFNEFGYENLIPEYEASHPNIKIEQTKTGQSAPHHQNLLTKLGAGSGLADIEAIEEGFLSQVLDKSGQFNDLKEIGPADVKPERWLKWKADAATTKDGKVIGYGTDIGPVAMCYRKDLFEAAGLPTDPEQVKAMFATWDSYFEAGKRFVDNSEVAWFDSASQVFNVMQNQLPTGYYDTSNNLVIETNAAIKANWDKVTRAVTEGQSAKLVAWGPEWNTGFKTSAFATKTCPSWMMGPVEGNSGPENAGKWAITDAVPGGPTNWGGSYLTVPKQSKHPKEAAELAAWLTAPEQQIKAFKAKGPFPSQLGALDSPDLLSLANDYFVTPNTAQVFASQAKKVERAQFKGEQDGNIQDNVIAPALQAVEQGTAPDDGWKQAVEGAKKLAK